MAEAIPEGKKLKAQYSLNEPARALESLTLEDAFKANAMTFPEESVVKTELVTFDGLNITAALSTLGGRNWAVFSARAGDEAESEIENEANSLNELIKGWAFVIPEYPFSLLTKTSEQMIEEAAAESTGG
jgi:hypothetical protein